MSKEQLRETLRYIITEIYTIPANDTDLDRVTTQMHTLLAGITLLKRLDFSPVETAGILQLEE